MTVSLSPVARQQFWQNGVVAAGALLFTYAAGTSTKQTTYTDSTGATPNTNPIVLDANGQCEIFLNPALTYKYTLSPSTDTDPPSNPYWTVDNIAPTASYAGGLPQYLPQENQTATANQTAFTLASVTYDSTNPASLQVFVNGLLTEPTVDWLATSNTQVTFTNALTAGDLVTFISSYIVGLRGPQGATGATGATGSDAFTTTSAIFTQPSVGSSVSVQVVKTAWMAQGQILYITGGGYYTLTTITDGTHAVLTNLGYTGNTSPGSTVSSGAAVTAGGTKGQDGAGAGSVTSVALALPADLTVTGSPVTSSGTLTGAWATTPTGTGAMVRATGPTLAHPTVSDYALFTTQGAAPTYAAGVLFYETANDALTFYNGVTGNDQHLGQEVQIRAYNQTGVTIPAGSAVYINGQHSQFPTIALAKADALATSNGIGITNTAIANNSYGYVVTLGKYTGLDTSAFTSGDTLYVSTTTAGALQNTAPASPNYAVKMGTCIYSNPSQGVLYVSDGPVYVPASAIIGVLPVANGGTGTATPGLVAGTNVTISGTWPNQTINSTAGGGTVTSVSGVSSNGFNISVNTPTTTPSIVISTAITGILKGNGTVVSAAAAGTDYAAAPTGTASQLLANNGSGGFSNVTVGSNLTLSAGTLSAGSSFGVNRIINGGMWIDQRNSGTSQTFTAAAALAYSVDRWYGYCTGANVTGQQVAGTSPNAYMYQFTGAASVTGIGFAQRIEAINVQDLASTTATLSVDLSNSLLTTVTWTAYYANTTNTFGALASPTKTQIATGTFTVNSTVTRYSTQITMPANTINGVEIAFSVGAQTSGTWKIGRVQLESGSTATGFEPRLIGSELLLCQRYLPAYNGSQSLGLAWGTSTTQAYAEISHSVPPRIAPTGVTILGGVSNFNIYGTGAISLPATAITYNQGGFACSRLSITVASGFADGRASGFSAIANACQILFTGCEL